MAAFAARQTRNGVALGVALAVASSVGSAVGWSSHPVGDDSHPVFEPRNKACSGNPPRQTEDPLAPPCVPFFDGDNGGATARGVDGDGVLLALYNDLGVDGDIETIDKPAGPDLREHRSLIRTLRAQLRYFSNHFQTYDRRVRIVAVSASRDASCAEQRNAAERVQRMAPFAAIVVAEHASCAQGALAASGIPSVGIARDLERATLDEGAGLIAAFHPDMREDARITAAFICDQLMGRQARFSADPAIARSDRRIEILAPAEPAAEPFRDAAESLQTEIAARCDQGSAIRLFVDAGPLGRRELPPIDPSSLPLIGDDDDEEEGPVTSYVCVCDVAAGHLIESQRAHAGEHPEWILPMIARGDDARTLMQGSLPGEPVFGVTSRWVLPELSEQYATRAYHEIQRRTEPNLAHNHDVYHAFMLGFSALQQAGPYVTTENWIRGLRSMGLTGATAELPVGRFRDDDQVNTFRESALSWWWNPASAEAPGVPGCIASAASAGSTQAIGTEDGWVPGDGDLFVGTCLQPERR